MNSLFRIMTRFFMFLPLAAIHYVVWWDDSWYSRVDHGWAMDPSRLAFEHHWMRALSWLQRHLGENSDIFGPHRWQCYQNWAYTIWVNTIGSLPWKVCQLNVARNHLRPVQGLEQYRRCTPHQMVRWWTNDKVPRNCILRIASYYCISSGPGQEDCRNFSDFPWAKADQPGADWKFGRFPQERNHGLATKQIQETRWRPWKVQDAIGFDLIGHMTLDILEHFYSWFKVQTWWCWQGCLQHFKYWFIDSCRLRLIYIYIHIDSIFFPCRLGVVWRSWRWDSGCSSLARQRRRDRDVTRFGGPVLRENGKHMKNTWKMDQIWSNSSSDRIIQFWLHEDDMQNCRVCWIPWVWRIQSEVQARCRVKFHIFISWGA